MSQVKSETARVSASIASVNARISTVTANRGVEAISNLKSFLKPQHPRKVRKKGGGGEVKQKRGRKGKSRIPLEYNSRNGTIIKLNGKNRRGRGKAT